MFVLKSFTLEMIGGGGGGNFHWKCCDRSKTKIQLIYTMYELVFGEQKQLNFKLTCSVEKIIMNVNPQVSEVLFQLVK